MKILEKNQDCSGCHACFSACPKGCIRMEENAEGFLYPLIDTDKCIACALCERVCPVLKNAEGKANTARAYACYNLDEKTRLESSSGGIFTLIAEKIIDMGGAVFGTAFDEEFNVKHICVESKEGLSKLRGSKYVQSTIGNAYIQAKEMLDDGRVVLFTGTPCQTDGLLSFLGKGYNNLYTQDLICHGAPSPKVWRKYIVFREEKAASKTKRTFFRLKENGWKSYSVQFQFANCTEYKQIFSGDLFMNGFLKDLYLRPSCYNCHSKSLNRNSDITLADFWGVENILPEMFDDKGTSLVFVNSDKGKELFESIRGNIRFEEVDINEAVKWNSSAYQSVSLNKKRDKFFEIIENKDFEQAIKCCTKESFVCMFFRKAKRKLKQILKQTKFNRS